MKKILMCYPKHYQVEYSINPWMKLENKVDRKLAIKQWQNLKRIVENFLKVKTAVIKQEKGLPDMVFSTDTGLVFEKKFLKANFCYPQRQKEAGIYGDWFAKKGYKVLSLPKKFVFEGGDFLFYQDKILAGWGFRTKKITHQKLEKLLRKKIISLKLINPFFYHLDIALTVLDEKTLAFYPKAFDKDSRQRIKGFVPQVIEAKKQESLNFCLNSLVNKKRVIAPQGMDGLLRKLSSLGFIVKQIEISEFKKSGGGVNCLAKSLN